LPPCVAGGAVATDGGTTDGGTTDGGTTDGTAGDRGTPGRLPKLISLSCCILLKSLIISILPLD